jgi:hypothetical protein
MNPCTCEHQVKCTGLSPYNNDKRTRAGELHCHLYCRMANGRMQFPFPSRVQIFSLPLRAGQLWGSTRLWDRGMLSRYVDGPVDTTGFVGRGGSVGIATAYRLNGRGSIPSRRYFSTPQPSDRLSRQPNLPFNGFRGHFSRGWSCRSVKLTTHLLLVPR